MWSLNNNYGRTLLHKYLNKSFQVSVAKSVTQWIQSSIYILNSKLHWKGICFRVG